MALCMRARLVEVRSLELSLPMVTTRTGHVAVRVDRKGAGTIWKRAGSREGQPAIVSEKGDLLVYYMEEAQLPLFSMGAVEVTTGGQEPLRREAPNLSERGVRTTDKVGQLAQRRMDELNRAKAQQDQQDQCMWVALKRNYTAAEQFATDNFSGTILFDPFCSDLALTSFGAASFGWTNSQPMLQVDGAELLGRAGRDLVKKTLRRHRPYLLTVTAGARVWQIFREMKPGPTKQAWEHKLREQLVRMSREQQLAGHYYLLEVPFGFAGTFFDDVLAELLNKLGGKTVLCGPVRLWSARQAYREASEAAYRLGLEFGGVAQSSRAAVSLPSLVELRGDDPYYQRGRSSS